MMKTQLSRGDVFVKMSFLILEGMDSFIHLAYRFNSRSRLPPSEGTKKCFMTMT